MSNVVTLPNKRDWKYHAEKIAVAWNKQIPSIIETGQALIDAKEELEHGSFEAMVQSKLPFSKTAAKMLRAVAAHKIISNSHHGDYLPASWRTLYELTKLPEDILLHALKDGRVHPKMERKDVKALRPDAKDKRPPVSRSELIAAIQKDPTANQRDAAAAIGVSLGMYQRTRKELIGSGEIRPPSDTKTLTIDELRQEYVEKLKLLSRDEKIEAVDRIIIALGLNIRDWVSTVKISKKGK